MADCTERANRESIESTSLRSVPGSSCRVGGDTPRGCGDTDCSAQTLRPLTRAASIRNHGPEKGIALRAIKGPSGLKSSPFNGLHGMAAASHLAADLLL